MLATSWDGGGGDFNWNNPLNWSSDQLPGLADDVTIDVAGDVTIVHTSGANAINSLVSHESIDFSGGSLTLNASSSVFGQFNNSAMVEVLGGTLALGSGTHTGDFLIGSGASLSVGGLFEASSAITGPGDLILSGTHRGIVDIGGNVTLPGTTIEGDFAVAGDMTLIDSGAEFSGTPATVGGAATINGSMGGTGEVTIAGLLTWDLTSSGLFPNMHGTGTTMAQGGMHITGAGTGVIHHRTIENAGVAVFDQGTILAYAGGVLRNLPGGSFEIRNDVDIERLFLPGADPLFDNQGTFLKSTGAGVASLGIPFHNSGTVEAQSGSLAFDSYTQTAGTTRLSGGVIVAPLLNIQGGSLTGSGQIFGPVNGGGQVSPGFSPGVIQINGNYSQVASGALVIELAGGTAGNLPNAHDQLDVHGTVALAGALNVSLINGFVPVLSQTFVIVNNDGTVAVSGTFNGLSEGAIFETPGGAQFQISYDGFGTGNDVVVKAVNRPPVADAGGPYAINEGGTLSLNGSGSNDSDPLDTLTYSWDVNGDGSFGDATGVSPTLTWSQLQVLGINDGPRTVTNVRVRVDDGHAHVVDSPVTTLTVTNVAPLTTIAGPPDGVRGQVRSYMFSATDPSPGDSAVGFTYAVTWGDGSPTQTIAASPNNGTGIAINHVFTGVGTYTVHVSATDRNGSVSAIATKSVTITVAAIQTDWLDPTKRVLVVGGSTGNDDIKLDRGDDPGDIKVKIVDQNGVKYEANFDPPIHRIVVYGQAGDDDITGSGQITIPTWLYGQDGDDILKGGGGPNVLLGGAGDDTLTGGSSRDLLVGGTGLDKIAGNAADDLLIAGPTAYEVVDAALAAILAEWNSTRSYADRVNNLRGNATSATFGARANGNFFLAVDGSHGRAVTVFDDGVKDMLTGDGGQDWFLFNADGDNGATKDKVTDLLANESADDLDFIPGL